jgi:4-carboxymuconolactone decarboxylase
MSRVPLRKPDTDDVAAIYDRVQESAGAVPNLYQALAHSPKLLESWIDYAWSLREDAETARDIRELAILRVAQLSGVDYVWRSHWRPARHAGADETKLTELARWPESAAFSDAERAVLGLTDDLTGQAGVGDVAWQAAAEHFEAAQLVDLVLTISWYCCVARVVAALEVPLEAAHAKVPPIDEVDT